MSYDEIFLENIGRDSLRGLILIVTATDLETKGVHNYLTPFPDFKMILKIFEGDQTYYLGMLGKYKVVHVQCAMGSISRASSIMTISSALELLNCRVVIMVGIAFGVDESKQKIGDVLVAESIIPYNSKRVGNEETIYRGIEAPSSKKLLNRFKSVKTTWEYLVEGEKRSEMIPTRLLSGEDLIDNKDYRNSLILENPDSKGGEMEGAGVYAACDGKADWILIKGICDFADGEKGKNKSEKQNIAINAALSLVLELLNSTSAFKEYDILPLKIEEKTAFLEILDLNDVLFDLYDKSKEAFYIEREKDGRIEQKLKEYGVWIYGPSGCGKSNTLIRSILRSGHTYIQVSLASCIDQSVEEFFKEILYDLSSKTNGVEVQTQPQNFSECNKAICELLEKHYAGKEFIIFVEEIPISNDSNYKEFASKFFSLLISKTLIQGLSKIKFVLSSINDPTIHIQSFQLKIHQQLAFVDLAYWPEDEILRLVTLIEGHLPFSLPTGLKSEIISKSNGSPRFIKKYFRSIKSIEKVDEVTLRIILAETQRELM